MPHSISTPRNEAVCERFTSLYDELVLIVLVAGMLFVIGVQRNALLKYRPAYKGSSGPTSGDNLTPSVHPPSTHHLSFSLDRKYAIWVYLRDYICRRSGCCSSHGMRYLNCLYQAQSDSGV